jgi:hypothetical protein
VTKNLCQADMARRLGLTPGAFAAKVHQGKLDVSDFPLVGKVRVFPEDAVEVIRARVAALPSRHKRGAAPCARPRG